MDKQKQQLVILGALFLVLVFFLVTTFMPKKKSPSPVSAENTAGGPVLNLPVPVVQEAPKPDTNAAKASAEELRSQQEKAEMDWAMDPFFHSVDKEVYQGSSLTLKGVSIGRGRRRYATINDQIVTIGDSLFGYRVEEIDKTRVLLKRGTESYYLVFPEQ
jgi:hypothetical protein